MTTQAPHATDTSRTARLRPLRLFCLLEAFTLLALLLIAVPLKHLADYPFAVTIMGPVHGFAFLAFMWHVVQAVSHGDIHRRFGAKLGLAACVPFGGIFSWKALR